MPSWYGGLTNAEYAIIIARLTRIERKVELLQHGVDELVADMKTQGVASKVKIRLGKPTDKP